MIGDHRRVEFRWVLKVKGSRWWINTNLRKGVGKANVDVIGKHTGKGTEEHRVGNCNFQPI